MERLEGRLLDVPEESRWFDKGRVDLVTLSGVTFARTTLEPGWRWSTCIGPKVGARSCQERHVGYLLSGRLKVMLDDGTATEFVAGDAAVIPAGHDAWVIGEAEVVFLEFAGERSPAYAAARAG